MLRRLETFPAPEYSSEPSSLESSTVTSTSSQPPGLTVDGARVRSIVGWIGCLWSGSERVSLIQRASSACMPKKRRSSSCVMVGGWHGSLGALLGTVVCPPIQLGAMTSSCAANTARTYLAENAA